MTDHLGKKLDKISLDRQNHTEPHQLFDSRERVRNSNRTSVRTSSLILKVGIVLFGHYESRDENTYIGYFEAKKSHSHRNERVGELIYLQSATFMCNSYYKKHVHNLKVGKKYAR